MKRLHAVINLEKAGQALLLCAMIASSTVLRAAPCLFLSTDLDFFHCLRRCARTGFVTKNSRVVLPAYACLPQHANLTAPACLRFCMKDPAEDDHLLESVPLEKRRGSLTMTLLWITMVTCFPNVLAGFRWHGQGMSISQVLGGVLISCGIVLLYCIPACYLGSKFGLTYTVLSRAVFGKWGARWITVNVIWISLGWYALNAIFLADGIRGLFDFGIPQIVLVAAMAILMAVNNFFGFSGVANFAKFLAAPVLLIWVFLAFGKSVAACPASVWTESSNVSPNFCMNMISSFVVGICCWGNEPDYWRFGKPKIGFAVPPLLVSLLVGMVIFPLTGWMMARLTGVSGIAAATRLMNDYVFGGLSIVSALVLTINYVAVNDCGLYATINATENLVKMPRKLCVMIMAILAACAAVALLGYTRNFEIVAALSSIVLPGATVVMVTEAFLIKKIWGQSEDLSLVMPYENLPAFKYAATISLFIGCVVAIFNAGFIKGTEHFASLVPALPGWVISMVLYLILRPFELKHVSGKNLCRAEALSEESETSASL